MEIKILSPQDWEHWKAFRLEALQESPDNFASSYEEESKWPDSAFQEGLSKSALFVAFVDNILIGSASFSVLEPQKKSHRGMVWGIYVPPDHRGKGVASRLIKAVIAHAKERVSQLHLNCIATNLNAIRLYEKLGFKIYATEPRAFKVNDAFFDEHLMLLALDAR